MAAPPPTFNTTPTNPQSHHSQPQTQKTFTPAFNFFETAHEYILEVELPGLHDKKRTVIEFTDAQTILIRGKIERGGRCKRLVGGLGVWVESLVWVEERNAGKFRREFTFPKSINIEAAKATLKYGVLRIVVPKILPLRPRRIQIQ
ncbi:HSP20-like chaperone [Tuber borchii]|uniref:HSP20-like chaperone n=1 Tax=Tuber borchii TaxID=42251 RepID=A0A2T6ZXC3_TUBBO|nr:HSP20-like chaperone [Tuber borchii]